MNQTNTIIVISRYEKDTYWSKKLTDKGYTVLIYDHGSIQSKHNPYNVDVNKGKEASVYLKYIIDKYDYLPTYTVFLHDKKFAWHHKGNIADLVLENQDSKIKYKNLNFRTCSSIKNDVWKEMQDFYKRYLQKQLGPIEYFGDWTVNHLCCAQFIVHKSKILQHPKFFYENIYNWITKTKIDHQITGRLLEWTWRIIFEPKKYKLQNKLDINSSKYRFDPSILLETKI
jgi:hypothetical protein